MFGIFYTIWGVVLFTMKGVLGKYPWSKYTSKGVLTDHIFGTPNMVY